MADDTPQITVLFDGDCGFCAWCATALDRLDWNRRLRLVPLQSAARHVADPPRAAELARSLHVVDRHGRWERGGRACLRIAAAVPLLRPLAVIGTLPGIRRLVEPSYALAARHRGRIGRVLGVDACTYDSPDHRGMSVR